MLLSVWANAQTDTLTVNHLNTLHLMCSDKIIYCDLGSNVITAAVAPGVPELLRIKATAPFEGFTNLSVLTEDKVFTTYTVRYAPHLTTYIVYQSDETAAAPAHAAIQPENQSIYDTITEINRRPAVIGHLFARTAKIECNIEHIYTANDKVYITLKIANKSAINYTADATFALADIQRNRRAAQEITLRPVETAGSLNAPAMNNASMTFAFTRLSVSDTKEIIVSIYERDGYRNLTVTITGKDIANARIFTN